jgi:hypothetical protein
MAAMGEDQGQSRAFAQRDRRLRDAARTDLAVPAVGASYQKQLLDQQGLRLQMSVSLEKGERCGVRVGKCLGDGLN